VFSIKDSAGTVLVSEVNPKETLTMVLVDNSTPAGTWKVLERDDPLVSLGDATYSTLLTSGIITSLTMLSPTTGVIATTQGGARLVAFTISGSTITFGAETVATATATWQNTISVRKLNATTGIVIYSTAVASHRARAFTVSGTTITFGTEVVFSAVSSTGYRDMQKVFRNTDTSGVFTYESSSGYTAYARAFTISGTTITLGTQTTLFTGGGEAPYYGVVSIGAGKYAVSAINGAVGSVNDLTRIFTASGTTLTLGTLHTSNLRTIQGAFSELLLSFEDDVFYSYSTSVGSPFLRKTVVSGTTVVSETILRPSLAPIFIGYRQGDDIAFTNGLFVSPVYLTTGVNTLAPNIALVGENETSVYNVIINTRSYTVSALDTVDSNTVAAVVDNGANVGIALIEVL
jgi:hypothetical protein